ncbi:Hypothetical predicted protein [Olea europaea subsp. europaea]|uniref:Uncharacterized protein n=1 Tax=Olea europaea subsp. europaea TaxID=158383 RepID=A0A8S0UZR4_OLEEU|nr:Hypothetical predicted protein [Olea europaea subsp. europaea]
MVAISLYKGNLHKISDVPHRWPMPARKLSLRDFKILHRRRLNALSLLQSASTPAADIATTSNPNPGIGPSDDAKDDNKRDSGFEVKLDRLELDEGQIMEKRKDLKEVRDEKVLENLIKDSDALAEEKNGDNVENVDKAMVLVNPESEAHNKENDVIAKEKRKKEVEEKLVILNEKKHSLVQVLKQILNAEEELKRQSSMQGMAGRQFAPLLVDTTNDSGSMTRLNTPKTASDGNLGGGLDVGDADDTWNHNMRSCNVLRLSSTSPSSDSQLRKPASNAVPHTSRTALGAVGSPLCFAPSGQQGHTSNPSSVSVSGTNYIASSPSPAASGGTSVLRDGRLPSPWN